MKKHSALRYFLFVFILLSLGACSSFTEGTSFAKEALNEFHANFNNKEFDAIFDSSHETFKEAVNRKDFIELLEAIYRKLGPTVESEGTGWNVNTHNFTTYVTLTLQTTFSEGEGAETFRFIIEDKKAFLVHYNINSNDLIIK